MKQATMERLFTTAYKYNILPLTSRCNVKCAFCSHRQNPQGLDVYAIPPLVTDEVEDIIQFLSPDKRILIGESASRIMEGEPLLYEHFTEALEMIRLDFPRSVINITTNGLLMDDKLAGSLAEYGPVNITLSVNSCDALNRTKLGLGQQEKVDRAVELLNRYGIPYTGSIVAMPHITGWDDLKNTVAWLEERSAEMVRIFMPGFTKYNKDLSLLPHFGYGQLKDYVQVIALKAAIPVVLEPPSIEDLSARVCGVIRHSPAYRAGIKKGDEIVKVNGQGVKSRWDAFNRCFAGKNPRLTIRRNKEVLCLSILKDERSASGIVFDMDIDNSIKDKITRTIVDNRAEKPLVLTSPLGHKTLSLLLDDDVSRYDIRIEIVNNDFFGGNIGCAGLMVVEDILSTIKSVEKRFIPDLIILPAIAFDDEGRDITGRNIFQTAITDRIPVILI